MSYPTRGPGRRPGIDGQANGAGRRRAIVAWQRSHKEAWT